MNYIESPRFSNEDHQTWRLFFAEILTLLDELGTLIHPYYRENIVNLSSFRDGIPSLSQINQILQPIGWSAQHVNGYEPTWEIAHLLAKQILPISSSIRRREELFFAKEPDIIHDIFGHLPSILNSDYRRLLALWSNTATLLPVTQLDKAHYHLNKLIAQSQGNVSDSSVTHLINAEKLVGKFISSYPSSVHIYDKAYLWIFEFGIIKHLGQFKILGSGLLSSINEMKKLATGTFKTQVLNINTILTSYSISTIQDEYLVVDSIDQYFELLNCLIQARPRSAFEQGGAYAIH